MEKLLLEKLELGHISILGQVLTKQEIIFTYDRYFLLDSSHGGTQTYRPYIVEEPKLNKKSNLKRLSL